MTRRRDYEMKPQRLDEMVMGEDDLAKLFGSFGHVVMPEEAEAPILTGPVRAALHQWLFEMNAAPELEAVGLKPRSRAILSGPPGCGKTTLAHHIAARLGLPLVVVQSQQIVQASLGGTGNNLAALFALARKVGDVALFFDEFDALAKARRSVEQACDAETNNITIAILQEMDRFEGLLFAATNIVGDIDPAIWRRFQMQIEIGFPGEVERFAITRRYLDPFAAADTTVEGIADAFTGASPALIKEGCESIKRSLVLGERMGLDNALQAILGRFVVSAAPAEGVPTPTLWEKPREALVALAALPWPPVLAA